MNKIYGKIFKTNKGEEFGIIREASAPFPDEIASQNVLAEDGSGNFFLLKKEGIYFWDHETNKKMLLAVSIEEFISGCVEPSENELQPGQVESVWVDPEFAKEFGVEVRNSDESKSPNKGH